MSVCEIITVDFMTDESDRDGAIALHPLHWRSEVK